MISKISLTNFRRFKKLDLNFSSNLVILIGSNALGKTSVLESIFLVSTLKSPRTSSTFYLIKENEPFSKINLETEKSKYEIILNETRHKASIDDIEIKRSRDFVGNLHTVFFSPSDLNLITGTPSKRRQFLDMELSLLNKKYLDCLSKSKYFLHERNEALKKGEKDSIINFLTDELIYNEKLLVKSRIKFINLLNEKLKEIHSNISSGETLRLEYKSSFPLDNTKEFYLDNLNKDRILKTTNFGFQRDDFKVFLQDKEALNFASEGQIRNIAISIKIALVEIYESYLKESPILLLDDVFSELDKERQRNLINFLNSRPQTFITTTSLDEIPDELLDKAQIIKLEKEK